MTSHSSAGFAAISADLHPFALPGQNESVTAPSPVSALRATCSALPGGGVRFAFVLEGRVEALRLPAGDAPNAWPLWQHTCFEAFLSEPGEQRYREFNFSPARLWAAMAFKGYREMECELTDDTPPPIIETEVKHCPSTPSPACGRGAGVRVHPAFAALVRVKAPLALSPTLSRKRVREQFPGPVPTSGEWLEHTALHLTAQLPPTLLPSGPLLRIGLSAVIERTDGQLEYWALRHPVAERADFHHQDGWTLRLDTRGEQQP